MLVKMRMISVPFVIQKHADFATTGMLLAKRCIHAAGSCYSNQRDYYEVLGVPKNASQDERKKGCKTSSDGLFFPFWHLAITSSCSLWGIVLLVESLMELGKLAKKYHPDANNNNPFAKSEFQEIRDAYEILQDSKKRAQYDMVLPIFPCLVGLPLEKFQMTLPHILQGSAHTGPALTPVQVLVAIHEIVPERDGLALKKACLLSF
ncbi:hypothetical protein Patl1_10211 [Pistacia atlantica]|uniref:Uncharacterized protein n=1 Tax=Pistacia atlantica TaxID=434234 RepID=A0ACC1A6Q1_9ROSI|nr:hypothetical protein Patl1_10211 [Pistacia atlantica]